MNLLGLVPPVKMDPVLTTLLNLASPTARLGVLVTFDDGVTRSTAVATALTSTGAPILKLRNLPVVFTLATPAQIASVAARPGHPRRAGRGDERRGPARRRAELQHRPAEPAVLHLAGGTSMAAPHVARVIALMEEAAEGHLTPAQAYHALTETARPLSGYAQWEVGAGFVDASAATQYVRP